MKKIEKILAVIFVISLIMKYFHIPGYGSLLILSTSILAMVYYPFGFASLNDIKLKEILKKESYKDMKTWRILGSICLGMMLALLVIGILFKLQNFPGSKYIIGPALLYSIVALIIMIVLIQKDKDSYLKKNIVRTLVIGAIASILYFTSALSLKKIFYHDNPEYVKAYEKYINNPNDYEAFREFKLLREKMNWNDSAYFEKMKPQIEKEIQEDFNSRDE